MGRVVLVVAAAALAGCFNPDLGDGLVACGAGGSCPPGYSCDTGKQRCFKMPSSSMDLAAPTGDLAGSDGGGGGGGGGSMPLDMAGGCGPDGTRVCIDSTRSGVCMAGVAVADRSCPPGSSCSSGHCMPPNGATPCTSSKTCMNGTVCIMYNNNGGIIGYCTMPFAGATGGAGTSCTTAGYDNTCKTGVCASDTAMPTLKDCLYPCTMTGDCGGGLSCAGVVDMPSTIDGASVGALKFCR